MVVGVLQLDLHIHQARTLKEKRSVLKSMLEGLRRQFDVSAAEVEHQDLYQRALIGLAVVSNSQPHANGVLNAALNWVESNPRVSVLDVEMEFL